MVIFDFSKFSKLFYSIFSISFLFSNLVSDSCHYLIFSNFLLNQGEMLGASRYPPYSDNKIKTLGFLVKNRLVLIYNLGVIYNYRIIDEISSNPKRKKANVHSTVPLNSFRHIQCIRASAMGGGVTCSDSTPCSNGNDKIFIKLYI